MSGASAGYATGGWNGGGNRMSGGGGGASDIRADACDKLAAFMAQVTAQHGKKIPEADADGLIEQGQAVAESWGCG